MFCQSWEQKTYPEIAKSCGYDEDYIKYVGFQLWKMLSAVLGERVTKSNFKSVISRWRERTNRSNAAESVISCTMGSSEGPVEKFFASPYLNVSAAVKSNGTSASLTEVPLHSGILISDTTTRCNFVSGCRQDWGEAIDASVFYGRSWELATLERWIIQEQCRLVALLGIGGIGKTTLSVKLAEQVQGQFEYVIWRSLHNAPSLESLLASLIQVFANLQEGDLPNDVNYRILRLLDYLRSSRCLIVLDNAETIIRSPTTQETSEGYERYGELFKRIGESPHQSCLVLTSREKPKEVAALEGETSLVRSLQLSGLTTAEGREIFKGKGNFTGSENDWRTLIQSYAGNPLALKIVATTIRNLFDSNISNFLSQGTVVFGDIQNLLEQQFSRLSKLESEIMYWLAINREPVPITELKTDILLPILPSQLLEALESLERKSLIEKGSALFTLQPVVIEYVTNRLIIQVSQEIETQSISIYKNHALIKAQVKDYIQNLQRQFILQPISNQLLRVFGHPKAIERRLMQILSSLRGKLPIETGYAAGNTLNLLRQLQLDLCEHDFSQLTVWQTDLRDANLHRVNFSNADLSKSIFTENLGYIFAVAASADENLIATSDTHNGICLWRVADGQQLLSWYGHTGWVRCITFSADGKTLASGSNDQTIKLWDVRTGQCLLTLQEHKNEVSSVAFSPAGNLLASGSGDSYIKLWDTTTGQCYQTLQGHKNWVCSVAFSPDGSLLASGGADSTVKLWDVSTGQCRKSLHGHADMVWSVTFSKQGNTVISGGEDCTVKLWDVTTGECQKTLSSHTERVLSVVLSADAQTLASSSADCTVKLWDISTGQQIRTLQGHSSGVWSIAYSANGETLISSDEASSIKLWNVRNGQCLRTFRGYNNALWSIAFSPDGQTIVSGGTDQLLKLWQISDGKCIKAFKGHTSWIPSVAYSPDGRAVVSSSADATIKLWDIGNGRCLRTFKGHSNWVIAVVYSPDGRTLASGGADKLVRIWDIHTGKILQVLPGHINWIYTVAFSPNGQLLASGSVDQTIRLWNVSNYQCIIVLQGHINWIWSVAFSPDGQTLASGSEDKTVKIWHIPTGKVLRDFSGHTSAVISVAFSPDGQILASAGTDNTIRLWNISTGQVLRILCGHTERIFTIAFLSAGVCSLHNQGQVLASSSEDQTIRFWDIETGECLKIIRSDRPYEGMDITGATGLTTVQKATLKALGAVDKENISSL